jgi:hypothetical protein
MSDITLEAAEAKLTELTELITKLRMQPTETTSITLPETTIELRAGERYAGAVLDADGKVMHHLVLLAEKPEEDLSWQAAMDWAASVGGALPTRQEQSLLFANCKAQFDPSWYWSSQTHEKDASYAWDCYFVSGTQGYGRKSDEGCARAVRRA